LETGLVYSVIDGVVSVFGAETFSSEIVEVGSLNGVAFNLLILIVQCTLLGADDLINQGDTAARTFIELVVEVGFYIVGRVIDPICQFLDGKTQ
jgi:F-type H+/Na+-transporting ATPase subunit alpha